MKKCVPLALLSAVLLTACGPNKIVADLPSPDGSTTSRSASAHSPAR